MIELVRRVAGNEPMHALSVSRAMALLDFVPRITAVGAWQTKGAIMFADRCQVRIGRRGAVDLLCPDDGKWYRAHPLDSGSEFVVIGRPEPKR